MKFFKRIIYPFAPILFLAFTILLIKLGEFKIKPDQNKIKHFNSFTYQGTEKSWDETGKLTFTIKSPLMKNEVPSNNNYYKTPHAQVYSDDGSIWTITADRGINMKKDNEIILIGHVNLHRPATQTKPETTIKTSKVNYNTLSAMAFCPNPTTIIQPTLTFKADNATLDVKNNAITKSTNMHLITQPASKEKNR
jgi:LPS export ABC transporter protein LptC